MKEEAQTVSLMHRDILLSIILKSDIYTMNNEKHMLKLPGLNTLLEHGSQLTEYVLIVVSPFSLVLLKSKK